LNDEWSGEVGVDAGEEIGGEEIEEEEEAVCGRGMDTPGAGDCGRNGDEVVVVVVVVGEAGDMPVKAGTVVLAGVGGLEGCFIAERRWSVLVFVNPVVIVVTTQWNKLLVPA